MARKRLTEVEKRKKQLEKEYERQLNRIDRLYIKLSQQGFISTKVIASARPEKIKKSTIEKLKNIKIADLRAESQFIDPYTGEMLNYATEKRRIEKIRKQYRAEQQEAEKEQEVQEAINSAVPLISIVDDIITYVHKLPQVITFYLSTNYYSIDISDKISAFVDIIKSNTENYEYIKYLYEHETEIYEAIDNVQNVYWSDDDTFEYDLNHVAFLLNSEPLSLSDIEAMQTLSDYYTI